MLAAGLLVHNETLSPRLSWSSKLAHHIPNFGLEDPIAANGTTINDAMSHRTGMPRHDLASKTSDDVPALVSPFEYYHAPTLQLLLER